MTLVSKDNIEEYIPQRAPMIMVDTIEECDENTITTFEILSDNIFVDGGVMREPGLMENMAQTAAARAGYLTKKHGLQPKIGFIGAIKKMKVEALPKVGETIRTTLENKGDFDAFSIVECTVTCQDQVVASTTMNIFITDQQ